MRSTLHYITEAEFPFFHEGTGPQRLARRYRSLRRLGVSAERAGVLRAQLLDEMPANAGLGEELLLSRATRLTADWLSGATPAHMAWQLVRLLWDHGDIRMDNRAPSWATEDREFVRVQYMESVGAQRAREYVIRRYVEGYGPVSLRDIAWWTAFDAKSIAQAIAKLKADGTVTSVRCQRSGYELFFPAISIDPTPSQEEAFATVPVFLAYEDPFIKAYFHTRFRYGSASGLRSLFHSTGEAKASVLLRGEVRGIWVLPSGSRPATLLLCPKLSKPEHSLIADRWRQHLKTLVGDAKVARQSSISVDQTAYVN
ncbi:MAG: crosslink repair DNA glycosylase YcaQ family protein [Burkholderiaceae bacterium]